MWITITTDQEREKLFDLDKIVGVTTYANKNVGAYELRLHTVSHKFDIYFKSELELNNEYNRIKQLLTKGTL